MVLESPPFERSTTTGADGRWSLTLPLPARWPIRVEAEGFVAAEGWIDVVSGRFERTELRLRPLGEVSPVVSEGAATSVQRWVEKGNSHLEQGQLAEARVEYERALTELTGEPRAEVLRSVARTHYLEGDVESALASLEEALEAAPAAPESRALYLLLAEQTGADERAERFIERLETASGRPEEPPAGPSIEPPQSAPTPLPSAGEATAHRRGDQQVRFTESSPWSDLARYRERYGVAQGDIDAFDPQGGEYDLAAESFSLIVPNGYSEESSYGVVVWVSPTPYGGIRRPDLRALLAERRLLWIGANDAGNRRVGWHRTRLALDAAHNVARLYSIDSERIYVAGYSGGGRIASAASLLYPEVFAGGLFLMGADHFEPLPVWDKPGAHWPVKYRPPDEEALEARMRDGRFVFLTGELDFNHSETRQIFERWRELGFRRATYLLVPEQSHYGPVPIDWLERALTALEPG